MRKLAELFNKIKLEIGIGILVIISLSILVYTSLRISKNKFGGSDPTYRLITYLENSAGLSEGTAIRSAGIKIGIIDEISLENQLAKVEMLIQESVPVYKSSIISVKSLGILGDKYIEIEQGSINDELLTDGEVITNFRDIGNLDQLFININDILIDISAITSSLSMTIGSDENQNLINNTISNIASLTASVDNSMAEIDSRIKTMVNNLDNLLANSANFGSNLDQLLQRNLEDLSTIAQNIATLSEGLANNLPQLSDNLNQITVENRQGLKTTIENLGESSEKLSSALSSIENSAKAIEESKGTVGQLINNEQTASSVTETLEGLNRFIGEANRIKLDLGFRVERQLRTKETKGYVSLYYIPRPDHYFIVELIDDPRGSRSSKTEDITTTNPDGSVENRRVSTTTLTGKYLLSLIIAQRYYDTLLRFGLFEGKAGIGVDQYFGKDNQFKLSLDAWDFSRQDEGAHYRASGSWRFLGNMYVIAGYDDFANQVDRYRQGFLGIGLDFNEDNLKLIASSLPIGGLGGN